MPENLSDKEQKIDTEFSVFVVLVFLIVICVNFYFLYFKKDYDFVVETACDKNLEECFTRDCSVEGTCPPNELSDFKRYYINAKDFEMCQDEDCKAVCENTPGVCEQIPCDVSEEYGESCIGPDSGVWEEDIFPENPLDAIQAE